MAEQLPTIADARMHYCRCCPHRPAPAYPDLHYPFAECPCCPRHIPREEFDGRGRPLRCQVCRQHDVEQAVAGAFLGLVVGFMLGMLAAGRYREAIISAVAVTVFVALGLTGWLRRTGSPFSR